MSDDHVWASEFFDAAAREAVPGPARRGGPPVRRRVEQARSIAVALEQENATARALVKELDGLLACYRTGTMASGKRLDKIGELRRALNRWAPEHDQAVTP